MMMTTDNSVPINVVGSSVFGRYPKISSETTYNMIVSDGWLVPYSGYTKENDLSYGVKYLTGRGIYNSLIYGFLIVVVGGSIFSVDSNGIFSAIYTSLPLSNKAVYIAENNNKQIIFCDGLGKYFVLFNYATASFSVITVDFIPVHVSFQDGYFIASVFGTNNWRLSGLNDGTSWNPIDTGIISTEPDNVVACVKLPSRGGQLFIFGKNCTESYVNVGANLFPYQKNTGYSIDYGCVSVETIAYSEEIVVWLAVNKSSNPLIMYSTGAEAISITTDGISYKLAEVSRPDLAFGYLFKQDGHLIYQLTFPHANDNFSLLYDFTTKMFFNASDYRYNFHPARHVEIFNGNYYFISYSDGGLYKIGSDITTYAGKTIPRSRITNTIRKKDSSGFIVNNLSFVMEQGETDNQVNQARIDLSISRDGGYSYGNDISLDENPLGKRKNKIDFRRLGYSNEFTARLRFWSEGRIVIGQGILDIK